MGVDRPNLLYDITKVLTSLQASVISANVNVDEKRLTSSGIIKLKVRDSDQLGNIISALKSLPGIHNVDRDISIENSSK
jgi:GTP pyrophosphokinase